MVTEGLTLDPALSDGNLMGKRYVDDAGAEILVTKAGKGTMSLGSTLPVIYEAAASGASDHLEFHKAKWPLPPCGSSHFVISTS